MTTAKPKKTPLKTPLKTASAKSKAGSAKPASKSLKAIPKKAKSIEKDLQDVVVPEKSPRKRLPAKKSVSKVDLPVPKTAADTEESHSQKTSAVLKALLENHSDEWFTVEQICAGLGTSSFGVSLLAFSIPEVVPIPVPGISAIVALPTAVVSSQMIMGKKELRLPKWLLKRKIPRKALSAAIHAVLPALKRIEKGAKPRGRWVSNPLTHRLLGLFIFLLALFIALPIPGTNMPPAIAIFITSLGLVERDGLLICVGILIGLASMVLIGAVALGSLSLVRGIFNF